MWEFSKMMDQIISLTTSEAAVPPLPPKTRRPPPTDINNRTTVLTTSATQEVFNNYSNFADQQHISTSTTANSCGSATGGHVVKIRINPEDNVISAPTPCIRINVNSHQEDVHEMIQRNNIMAENFSIKTNGVVTAEQNNPYFFYTAFPNALMMSSGQVSPSDTLDSGTCSDLDSTPPPLPTKKKSACVSVTVIGGGAHKRAPSLTSSGAEVDSDDNDSNLSCDSLNSGDLLQPSAFLPQGLLQDIRERSGKFPATPVAPLPPPAVPKTEVVKTAPPPPLVVDENTYEQRQLNLIQKQQAAIVYDSDCFYDFHLNEHDDVQECVSSVPVGGNKSSSTASASDESFAGYKDLLGGDLGSATIRSAKGTVRGVKNRVRAGIATFLQINSTNKSYKEKDANKVVVYTTTMGIVRDTYHQCLKVKQILRTLLVKFEERDVFMSSEYQSEIKDRMRCDHILIPQVFVDGQHIGDAETIERLNETGELRKMLKPYKSMDACSTCQTCGGYRLLPCPVCNGSKKSVHRNHFTTEFVALKCMNCDEVGLVKCSSC